MINIKFQKNKITVSGHSGYAPPGKDIVCSAISVLTETFIASVEALTGDEIKSDIRSGEAVITYDNLSENGTLLIESFFIGARGVAQSYPKYVNII